MKEILLWANVIVALSALAAATAVCLNNKPYWAFILYGPAMLVMTVVLLRDRK